jgi:hypothetical protein
VRVNGTLVEDEMRRFKGECEQFRFNESTSVPFILTTVKVPNLALTHKITINVPVVYMGRYKVVLRGDYP